MGEGAAIVAAMRAQLACLDQRVNDATRIDRIHALEELKAACAAAQVRETAAFAASQRAARLAAGVPPERADRGVAAQVALARRTSPWHAARYVGWSKVLIAELPTTFAALATGVVPESRAMIVARETIWLTREQRAQVDAEVAPPARVGGSPRPR